MVTVQTSGDGKIAQNFLDAVNMMFEKLKGQEGNNVLAVYEEKSRNSRGAIEATKYLGRISGSPVMSGFNLGMTVPTEGGHVKSHSRPFLNFSWRLSENPLYLPFLEVLSYDQEVVPDVYRHIDGPGSPDGLELFVGDEVNAYFTEKDWQGKKTGVDTLLAKGLNMLGFDAPEEFQNAYDKEN